MVVIVFFPPAKVSRQEYAESCLTSFSAFRFDHSTVTHPPHPKQPASIVITMFDKPPPLQALQDTIADPSNPIGMRMRAAYYLRQAYSGNPQQHQDCDDDDDDDQHDVETLQTPHSAVQEIVVMTLASGLLDARHGSLMRHEFAYVLGQLRDDRVSLSAQFSSVVGSILTFL